MSEPVVLNPNIIQLVVDITDISEATGLREIADWLDDQDCEYVLHGLNYHVGINHGGQRLTEEMVLTAMIELLKDEERCGFCLGTGFVFRDKSWYPEYTGEVPHLDNYGYGRCGAGCEPVDGDTPHGYDWVEAKAKLIAAGGDD